MQNHNWHHANCSACHDVLWINDCIEYVMLISMIIASVLVYKGIYQLDVNPRPISFLDNLLLLICFPSFLLFCILNVISGIYVGELNSSVFTNILIVSILHSVSKFKEPYKQVSKIKLFLFLCSIEWRINAKQV